MDIARTMLDHRMSTHSTNTVEALKEALASSELDVVVLKSFEEYLYFLVYEGPDDPLNNDPLRYH